MDDFDALPSPIQRRIDSAFTQIINAASNTHESFRKKRKLNTSPENSAGGFLVEVSDEEEDESLDDTIPFSFIPSALQILDLSPDDDEVLQVFRSAADGWSNTMQAYSSSGNEGGKVSRKDWRAVCSVLMSSGDEKEQTPNNQSVAGGGFLIEGEDGPNDSMRPYSFDVEDIIERDDAKKQPLNNQSVAGGGFLIEDEDRPNDSMRPYSSDVEDVIERDDDDAYEESPLSSLEEEYEREEDSDEYQEWPKRYRGKGKGKARSLKGKARNFSLEPGTPTPQQQKIAIDAFALFLESPPESESELLKKRLAFKDIHRVADLLKQKLKADEVSFSLYLHRCLLIDSSMKVQEMVSLFSTSPDKTMSFDDFTRMMLMAKLV